MPVFVVGPDDSKPHAGLIVVHEIFGLNDHIKGVARRFAQESLRVYAPDLFAGTPGLPDNRDDLDAMRNVWASIPDSQLIADLKAVLAMAISANDVQQDKIGTIGYCMGGAIAFMFACEAPDLAWVIDYYGRIRYPQTSDKKPRHPFEYTGGLNCPMLGLFSGIDELIPPTDIELLSTRLQELGKPHKLKVYPDAPHAFFNDERESYRADAAADAWILTMDFIAQRTESAVK